MKNKIKINYFIDFLLFISFVILTISGVFLNLLPHGSRRRFYGLGQEFEESFISVSFLKEIHNFLGYVMIFLFLIHFILHWKWIVAVIKSFFKRR